MRVFYFNATKIHIIPLLALGFRGFIVHQALALVLSFIIWYKSFSRLDVEKTGNEVTLPR